MSRFNPHYEIMGQDALGSAGGLAILWNLEEVQFENWVSMPWIILGKFKNIGSPERILLIGVYGPHLMGKCRSFPQNVRTIQTLYLDSPWIVVGDFNMITSLEEKWVGLRRTDPDMEAFGDMITEQRLVNIPTTNGIHTCNNIREAKNQIASRLDRFLISHQIINRDIFIETMILPRLSSDHWPISLEIDFKASLRKWPFGSMSSSSEIKSSWQRWKSGGMRDNKEEEEECKHLN